MKRKLQKCKVCNEWFNTTSAIMIEHYKLKHEPQFAKSLALTEFTVKLAMFQRQAELAPWPLSMGYQLSAVMTAQQINVVLGAKA